MPKARALKSYKIVNEVNIFWRFVAVGNGSKIPLFYFISAFAKACPYVRAKSHIWSVFFLCDDDFRGGFG